MTITRLIEGTPVKITLTDSELFHAYMEQETLFDITDLAYYADIMEESGETVIDRDKLDLAAQVYRKHLENSDNIADIRQDMAFLALDEMARKED